MLLHVIAAIGAYLAFVAGLAWRGYRWQSVKPQAVTAPPVPAPAVPTTTPEEGNR